jgi:hypothetical protein
MLPLGHDEQGGRLLDLSNGPAITGEFLPNRMVATYKIGILIFIEITSRAFGARTSKRSENP